MHFIRFESIDFSYTTLCQFRIFDPERAILDDLAIYTQNLVEHRLFQFSDLFN